MGRGMQIAVIGGGHGCYAAAASLSERGNQVRLWRRNAQDLEMLRESGGIEIRDAKGVRQVAISLTTSNIATALAGSQLIVIPLPATTHEALAPLVAPHLSAGQVVFLPPGTFGSMIFAKAMRAAGNAADVNFAETGTLPYPARKRGKCSVAVSAYATRLPTGVFPSRNSAHAFSLLGEAFPAVEPVEDVLSGALMNAGPIIHPPLIMMNAGPLEHFPVWDIHNEGTQPAIRRVTDALDAERISVREAFGYAPPHFPLADHYRVGGEEWMYGNSAHEKLTDSGDWREKIVLGEHRYMREDTEIGLSFLVSCARYRGVRTPLAEGLLALGGAICATDFYSTGRTLEKLGLASLSESALRAVLRDGLRANAHVQS